MVATAVLASTKENHFQNLREKGDHDSSCKAVLESTQVKACFKAVGAVHTEIRERVAEKQGNLITGFAKTEKGVLRHALQVDLAGDDAKVHKVAQPKIAPQKALTSLLMPSKPDVPSKKTLLGDVEKVSASTETDKAEKPSSAPAAEKGTRTQELNRFCQEYSIRSGLLDKIFANVTEQVALDNEYRRLRGRSAPVLELPSVELISEMLYRNGIKADAVDDAMSQQDLEENERLTSEIHARRIENIKEKWAKEAQSFSWGTAIQVFSWVGSFLGILSGIALIATGVGAIAGAFLLAAGLLNLGSQILDITGGWDKITDLFPGDDLPEKKRAIRTWIQISITVLSVILGGIGGVISGFKDLGPAMKFAGDLAALGLLVGHSAALIGKAVTDSKLKRKQANVKEDDIELTKLEASREDATEKLERRFANYEHLTELLGKIFYLRHESFKVLMKTIK